MRLAARALLSVLLLCLLCPVPARAYVRFGVENHGTSMDPAYVEKLTTIIADIHKAFIYVLRLRATTDVHVTLKFYKDKDEYENDARSQGNMRNYSALPPAFFRHKPMEIWNLDHPSKLLTWQMMLHESTHMFLHSLSEDCPIWIHEGLAESLQTARLNKGRFEILPWTQRDQTAKNLLSQGGLPALADYLDVPRQDWQLKDDAGEPMRDVSWSVCWFLLSSPEGRQLLNDLIRAHQPGRRAEKSSALVDRYWRGGTKALEAAWRAWIPGQRAAMPLDIPNPEEPSLTTLVR